MEGNLFLIGRKKVADVVKDIKLAGCSMRRLNVVGVGNYSGPSNNLLAAPGPNSIAFFAPQSTLQSTPESTPESTTEILVLEVILKHETYRFSFQNWLQQCVRVHFQVYFGGQKTAI